MSLLCTLLVCMKQFKKTVPARGCIGKLHIEVVSNSFHNAKESKTENCPFRRHRWLTNFHMHNSLRLGSSNANVAETEVAKLRQVNTALQKDGQNMTKQDKVRNCIIMYTQFTTIIGHKW